MRKIKVTKVVCSLVLGLFPPSNAVIPRQQVYKYAGTECA